MAETKVIITGESTQAVKAFDNVVTSVDRVYGHLGKLRGELEKQDYAFGTGKGSVEALIKAQSDYSKVLVNNVNAILKTEDGVNGLKKALKLLQAEYKTLSTYTEETDMLTAVPESIKTIKSEIDSLNKQLAESVALEKASAEQAKIKAETYKELARLYPKEVGDYETSLKEGSGTKALSQIQKISEISKRYEWAIQEQAKATTAEAQKMLESVVRENQDAYFAQKANAEKLAEIERQTRAEMTDEAKKAYEAVIAESQKAYLAQKEYEEKLAQERQAAKDRSTDINVLKATGDDVGLMNYQYREMEEKLRSIIDREGKLTDESLKLGQRMQQLRKDMESAARTSLPDRMKNLAKSFIGAQVAVFALRKVATLVTDGFREMAKAASEAEETANLFNTTFSSIEYSANRVANSISSSLGMSTQTIQQSLGLFGDLAMGYGQSQSAALEFAQSAVQTGLDIMSFKNIAGDTTEVLQTMASGLAGNFENFRKWGIIVTQAEIKTRLQQKGLDKLTGTALQYAKVQETLNIVQEKSVNAQGDMIKTLDSTENITRRLSEANKELMASMGDDINKVLNPIKKLWLEIAIGINNARKERDAYKSGVPIEGLYDIKGNPQDLEKMTNRLGDLFGDYMTEASDPMYLDPDMADNLVSQYTEKLKQLMDAFDASAKDIREAFDNIYIGQEKLEPPAWVAETISYLEETIRLEEQLYADMERRTNSMEQYYTSSQKFLDTLSGITGVSISTTVPTGSLLQYGNSDESVMQYQEAVYNAVRNGIKEALTSFDKASLDEFVSPIELALGDVTEADKVTAKLEEAKKLYEALYNESLTNDGLISPDEQKNLDSLIGKVKELKEQKDKLDASDTIKSTIESGDKIWQQYQLQVDSIGLTDLEKELNTIDSSFVELTKTIDELYQSGAIKTWEEYASIMGDLNDEMKLARDYATEYYNALEAENRAKEKASTIESVASGSNDIMYNALDLLETSGLSDLELAFREIEESTADLRRELLVSFNSGALTVDEYLEQLDILNGKMDRAKEFTEAYYKQLEGAEQLQEVFSAFGELGSMIQAFQNIKSGIGGIIMIIIRLVSQLDIVKKLASFLSDSILPPLNKFLAPLLPIISALSKIVQVLITTALEPIFPILKEVAKAIIFVLGIIQVAFGFVRDIGKKIVGTIQYGVLTIYNWIVGVLKSINIFGWRPFGWMPEADTTQAYDWMTTDILGNAANTWDEMKKTLQSIDRNTMEIEDNTSQNEEQIRLLQELYQKGLLSESAYRGQMASLTGQKLDLTKTFSGLSYNTTRPNSMNVYQDDIQIIINGEGMNADEVAQAVIKKLETRKRAGYDSYSA